MSDPVDLIVVGAGPAGRALAHRAGHAGLDVILVDPAPSRVWTATYGMYADDAPGWLDDAAIVARSETFTVFTPHRRVVDRGYLVLDPARFQRSLTLDGVTVVEQSVSTIGATTVTLLDGSTLSAHYVIDARGTARNPADPRVPRQTAYGTFDDRDHDGEAVLMDWRAAGISAVRPASFAYAVPTARGRLQEETCLAGCPPIDHAELTRRHRLRHRDLAVEASTELVDFPMYARRRPWRRGATDGALALGAAGGQMNPATGYSVAQSLGAVDELIEAFSAARDPRAALWTRSARLAYRLRMVGLSVLLSLDAAQLVAFFDAFFTLPVRRQRAYLSTRDDAVGILAAMIAVFVRCPPRLQATVAVATVRRIIPDRSP